MQLLLEVLESARYGDICKNGRGWRSSQANISRGIYEESEVLSSMDSDNDKEINLELVLGAQRGDPAALEKLCSIEWPRVYRIIVRASSSRQEAEDLTQEVFFRALNALPNYKPDVTSFSAYLAVIARNLVRDKWRSQRRWRSIRSSKIRVNPVVRNMDEHVSNELYMDYLLGAFARLAPRFQRVLAIRFFDDTSIPDAAKELNLSCNALRQLQYRALAALRSEFSSLNTELEL